MAAEKNKEPKKISHHITRRVYHDRYFAYTLAFLVVAGIALVSYVVVIGNRFSTDSSFASIAQPDKTYVNSQQGYSVKYPHTWVLELGGNDTANDSTVLFDNPANL